MDMMVDGIAHQITDVILNNLDVGEVIGPRKNPLLVVTRDGTEIRLEAGEQHLLTTSDLPLQRVEGFEKGFPTKVHSSRYRPIST